MTALNGGDASGLKGRLQYLNLQHFPPGFRIGKARRAEYGMEEVLAFSLWFSLTQASMTPIAATAFISDFWPEFSRLYLTAAEAAGVKGVAVSDRPTTTIAVITGNALKSSAKAHKDDLRGPARPFDILSTSRASLAKDLGHGFDARIVVDFGAVHAAFDEAMRAEPGPLTREQLAEEIRAFAHREGWAPSSSDHKTRPAPEVRPIVLEPRGQRLSEADYYYFRALEVIETVEAASRSGTRLTATPRLRRIAAYLLDPSPREGWKRWVEVGDSETAFIWAVAALIDTTTDVATGVPQTIIISAGGRVADSNVARLADALRETAMLAREYEPVHAD